LRDIGIVSQRSNTEVQEYHSDDVQEQRIYDSLTAMPQSVSDLVEKAQVDAAIINAKLTMLELCGRAKNVGNGMWVR